MDFKEIAIADVDISEFNTRRNLIDGQQDSTIEDLAKSIEKQGLLSPITVFQKLDGRYAVVAGQRRLLACRTLGLATIPAMIREKMAEGDATAISLVENVHRADMNPRDKALAFKALLDKFGDLRSVSQETGVGPPTIRKYIQLLDLSPELQDRLAGGEAKNTQALALLAQQFDDPDKQIEVWDKVEGFTQNVQQMVIRNAAPNLENLSELVDQAAEGTFNYHVVRNCPFDCPTVPEPLKEEVKNMIEAFHAQRA
ncbi:hypothetical protein BH24ACT21_BH24ACT21_12190 [soil metagenome]